MVVYTFDISEFFLYVALFVLIGPYNFYLKIRHAAKKSSNFEENKKLKQ